MGKAIKFFKQGGLVMELPSPTLHSYFITSQARIYSKSK